MDIKFHGSSHHQPDHQSTANPKDPYVFWDCVEHSARVTVLALLLPLLRGHEGIADDAGDQADHREAANPQVSFGSMSLGWNCS